ncbi:MAG: RNA methyltransferase [Flavobacteriales bacterium]|nr:RNA methyltransferase [Bacteroidota bacterium]MCB9239927.1 RNA methyltransferase [Flavobacteriales bacterium]
MPRKLKNIELQRLNVDDFRTSPKQPVVVVLDNVRSMLNVGSVFRSCDAFRIEHLFLCGITPTPPHRDITKSAIGAELAVSWTYDSSTLERILTLKSQGYTCYAVEQTDDTISLDSFDAPTDNKIAIVLGHEVDGVDQNVIDACNGCLEIPQYGTKHSLNISVCAGIVLWELAGRKNERIRNNE